MRIAVFGGSFNPPHKGHVEAAAAAMRCLAADRLMVIPAAEPPHKELEADPGPERRLALTRLAFEKLKNAEVSNIEIARGGRSYTVDTLAELSRMYPESELVLLMGEDMLEAFEEWKDFRRILEMAELAAFPRENRQLRQVKELAAELSEKYGARVTIIDFVPTDVSSTEIRELLNDRQGDDVLPDSVYGEIIRKRDYDAKPDLVWLRIRSQKYLADKRIPHVLGCEQEAVRLAERWGADTGLAAEAGILHDITKKLNAEEQLKLCEKYDIIADTDEKSNFKLLHAKTGAAFARDLFGINDEVYGAIFWHTTGRRDMTLLEKIIYMADYMEPNRSFEGVNELRRLAYLDLDRAMILGLEMSVDELRKHGVTPHRHSLEALEWLKTGR